VNPIKYTKKPILGKKRANQIIDVINSILLMTVKRGSKDGMHHSPHGGILELKRSGDAAEDDEVVTITGPATVYEEDGETVNTEVADGIVHTLTIAYREVSETINGNCTFNRKIKGSLPYILH
jgi:hypothetical protein